MQLPALLRGALVKRYKRFLADIKLDNGEVITAHCPNPGSMRGLAEPGWQVYVSHQPSRSRKLAYTWELVEAPGGLVCVNTARANALVEEALISGVIEPLRGFNELRREVPFQDSRIDFQLEFNTGACLVEVKNVTLSLDGEVSGFPDSVTLRGRKHLLALSSAHAAGFRSVLLFCSTRSDTREIRPAHLIDPKYAEALRAAAQAGVEVLGYAAEIELGGMKLTRRVPVRW